MDGNFKENTDQVDSTSPRAILRGLVYENKQIPLELANELEQLLSSSMYLETASILKMEDGNQVASGGGIGVPAEALPWLWMILTFTSTTVATTILSKISEDIYNRLKQSIVGMKTQKQNKQNTNPAILWIEVNTDEVMVLGQVRFENYEVVIEAVKAAKQMVLDASKNKAAKAEKVVYKYDVGQRMWILEPIENDHDK